MCKVTCRACGRPFTVVGIIRRGESCFCSVKCLRDNLAAREETQNAVAIEFHPKEPDVVPFHHQAFKAPGLLGILGH